MNKDLLLFTPEELAALTDEELVKLCEIFFPITRPSKVLLNKSTANAIFKKMGINPAKVVKNNEVVKNKELEEFIKKFGEDKGKVFYEETVKIRNSKR